VTSARVTTPGFALDGAAPSWGRFAGARDPLAAAAGGLVGARNPRLERLDRPTLSALVAAHLVQREGCVPDALLVAVDEGSAAADRVYWATARACGGAYASPMLFTATLPSAVAGELAMTFGLRGPCVVVTGPGAFVGGADAVMGRAALGVGPCLVVHLTGWDADGDGEASAFLERGPRAAGYHRGR
jgi:hypothetical protein